MEQKTPFEQWLSTSAFNGANQAYMEELYEAYLQDPESIEPSFREIFDSFPQSPIPEQAHSQVKDYFKRLVRDNSQTGTTVIDPEVSRRLVRALQWVNAHRNRGHLDADLDPLKLWERAPSPTLSYKFYGFTDNDLDEEFDLGRYVYNRDRITLRELAFALKNTYCTTIGLEFMHVNDLEARTWLQSQMENLLNKPLFNKAEKINFLKELTAADGLERYLGAKYPGAKRFSLEGSDAFIPLMKEIIRHGAKNGVKEIVMGMAHRGRLNMLVNVLGKKPAKLFAEFDGIHGDDNRTGDVKYHQGFSSDFMTDDGLVHLALAFNPSHLEIVSPVVTGSVRARQKRIGDEHFTKVLPITVHGDSAVIGQGVVQETLNMSATRGYTVGGTIRVVINNQIGFTTSNTKDTRSTEYCTDIAKMIEAPVIHVNGDDPEAVAYAARMAVEFRTKFHRDIFIDLVSYRRHGHNEADEPLATQPVMYKLIRQHPTPRKVYADRLISENIITEQQATELMNDYRDALDHGECVVPEWRQMDTTGTDWNNFLVQEWTAYESHFPAQRFKDLAQQVCEYPTGYPIHPRVEKIYTDRALMAKGEKLFDWGMAETMAYATLLDAGYHVRLSGEDAGRGTFFHRLSVLHNMEKRQAYLPLCNLNQQQGRFEVWDSVLSEEAVLAFEYGYATAAPKTLTIWEAQFGDFANGAQVVIDQFISSGEQKWGRMCGLVMLLPHGYEGQGPEHSSARLERYLQLCAQQNMQVCVPSTPAQIYHLLRRQMLRKVRRPLVVISPKSLLRNPLAVSHMDELINGQFQNVIGEVDEINPADVKRVVLCAGKVYYDLLEQRRKNAQNDVAIIRIEQLYPYPHEEMQAILAPYAHVKDFVWCQEEPLNQGAWYCSQHNFKADLPKGATLSYVGRPASASPAVGYMSLHNEQQRTLIAEALTI